MVSNSKKTILWTQNVSSKQEDQLLDSLILLYGHKNWKKISSELLDHLGIVRTSKQCRDRWINFLRKGLNNKDLTEIERTKLIKLFEYYGTSWNKISSFLPGHSENQLKNFINSTIRRNIRRYNKAKPLDEKILVNSIKLLECPEVKAILLTHKRLKNTELISMSLSSHALEFINSIEEKEENVKSDKGEEKDKGERKRDENEERVEVLEIAKMLIGLSKRKTIIR